ncbi:two-partner secretion domain-containing protein [Kamptonema formosum]|uniref:two-partner secretion domain-containing protein n=1 Tax=Kamptonema formosum TaxID=331992 RepID=UPI000367E3B7|nr:S-layer family protein [Oscillatoria sp. PCC 10802]
MYSACKKQQVHPLWISGSLALCFAATTRPSGAQIVPDATLPVNSTVRQNGSISAITGGSRAGGNLFHSFSQFSVPTGTAAHFNNALDIQNIITRVTGSEISNIDGSLKANGTANLFLLNPNGIIFGPNASLNIGGSFLASTASGVKFADGREFSATAPNTAPLLTVSVPVGLQFGASPGSIRNQSLATNSSGEVMGLAVQPEKTLALVGGDVLLEGGYLTAPGGRIELGSVGGGSAAVSLASADKGYALGYSGVRNFQDIQLSREALVNADGEAGGDIQIQARRLWLDGSLIKAVTLGAKPGGTVALSAQESVEMKGSTADGQYPSQLVAGTVGTGPAGDVKIATGQLLLQDGASISANSSGDGQGGDLTVQASESVQLVGTSAGGQSISSLSSETKGTGAAGNLTIATGRLQLRDGAQVSATSLSDGQGGNLTVTALSVELVGTSADGQYLSGLFTSGEGTGAAGNVRVAAGRLLVRDGARVQTTAFGEGRGGDLTVQASEFVDLAGTTAGGDLASGLLSLALGAGNAGNLTLSTGRLTVRNGAQVAASTLGAGRGGTLTVSASDSIELIGKAATGELVSGLFARSRDAGDAGNVIVSTGTLRVRDGAVLTVAGLSTGNAGNLQVRANSIRLDSGGTITAATVSGEGGDIALRSRDLILRRNSAITATAGTDGGRGNGGNITISTDVLAALENSDITANAYLGDGGKIQISTRSIFRSPDSDITASSQYGLSGTVEINTPDVDPSKGLFALPASVVDAGNLIASGCETHRGSTFYVTGRGGIPASPTEPLAGNTVLVDFGPEQPALERGSSGSGQVAVRSRAEISHAPNPGSPIVEAQGWVIGAGGEVILTANPPGGTPHPPWQQPAACRQN